MGWYMPSYGRPERLRELLEAPGGWPEKVVVLINEDDPARERYFEVLRSLGPYVPWRLAGITPGSRCADAHRHITKAWPDDAFYGLLCDDHWPISPGWHEDLILAAGKTGIATPAGEVSFPKIRNTVVIGGDMVRAWGSLVPPPIRHNFEDNFWDHIAEQFEVLVPLPTVIVEHRHPLHGTSKQDSTYDRGSGDFENDRRIFQEWMGSPERVALDQRVGDLLGTNVEVAKISDFRLAIIVPIQDEVVDLAYHKSLNTTLAFLGSNGFLVNVRESAGGSHIGKARERVLWWAMQSNPTHILCIDADMGWEPKHVTRLLMSGHDFSAIAGVRKRDSAEPCVNFLPEHRFHERTHFLEVRDVGFAFVMLKVEAIRRMCAAYPELRYNAGEHEEYALFLDMIDKTDTGPGPYGERLPEDFSFCRRWRAIGGEIWLDHQSAIIHAGRKEYTGRVADLFEKPK
jgi:hypothetical protein